MFRFKKKICFFTMYRWSAVFLNNLAFLQYLDHLNFLCIFHKQAGSRSESGSIIKVKVGSGSGSEKIISDPQHWNQEGGWVTCVNNSHRWCHPRISGHTRRELFWSLCDLYPQSGVASAFTKNWACEIFFFGKAPWYTHTLWQRTNNVSYTWLL
jgi:hypothetical protein